MGDKKLNINSRRGRRNHERREENNWEHFRRRSKGGEFSSVCPFAKSRVLYLLVSDANIKREKAALIFPNNEILSSFASDDSVRNFFRSRVMIIFFRVIFHNFQEFRFSAKNY